MNNQYDVTNVAELESILGEPKESSKQKVRKSLDGAMQDFVRQTPLIFLSTIDENDRIDVSPKGDAPGFVHIDEHGNLLIPDRPGNKLIFGFKNILRNNNIGLIFVVPNMRETLRIKGKATLSRDPVLLQQLEARGKPALLCTYVSVEECFFHCGKAMIRSNMWKPEAWVDQNKSFLVESLVARGNAGKGLEQEIEVSLEKAYRDNLY